MKIKIPIIPVNLFIFIGKKGFKKFKGKINKKFKLNKNMSGYNAENYIWIYKYNRKSLIHELNHFFDWLYIFLNCEKELEFKAFLAEYIINKSLKKFENVFIDRRK